MKKKIWLFVAITAIIGILLSYVVSYARDDISIFVNLGKSNSSGIGYGIGDPTQVNGKYIWELNQYNSNDVGDKVAKLRNLYCIKADYGETWDNQRNKEGIVEYNLSYDLQKERESLLNKLVDDDKSDLIKSLLDPSGPVYREMLWLLDNFYISGETDITTYLSKAGIDQNFYAMYNVPTPLTDSEIIAVQKAVIWYFTNYLLGNEEIYNNYKEGISADETIYPEWMTVTTDSGVSYKMFTNTVDSEEGKCKNAQIVKLYNYLVDSAKSGASLYTEQNNYTITSGISVDTTGLSQEDGKYKLTMISKDTNYIVGPIKINNNGATEFDIQIEVKNEASQTVDYKFVDASGSEIATDIKDLIGRPDGFYIMFDKSNNNKINISLSITNTTTQKTLWLKGTESDTEIKLDGEQPLVEINRTPETIKTEFTADTTDFDLALRKNIVQISRNGQTVTIDSRKPQVTVTPLDTTSTTANYAHRKDPVTIKTGDIVTYSITVYNEGLIDGYASKIIDQLPNGLQFIEENNGVYTSTRKDGKTNTYKSSYNPTDSSLVVSGETLKPKTILFTMDESSGANDLKGHTVVGEELDWETITFKCRVTEETKIISSDDSEEIKNNTVTLTNVAWIAEDSNDSDIDDRDSEPETSPNENNNSLHTTGDDVGYTGKDDYTKDELGDSNKYYEGEQDDDDFEKLELLPEKKIFDLGLKKFIAAVSHDGPTIEDDEYLLESDGVTYTRAPIVTGIYHRDQVGTTVNGQQITDTVMFKDNDKDPILVQNGDYVLYTIRVYNHGEINGYASLIKDSIPEGLEYVIDSEINANYLWNVESYQDSLGKTVITTDYFKKDGMAEEKGEKALLQALNPDASISEQNPDYIDVQVLCKVVEPQNSNRILINYAQISDDSDENGDEIDDIDSTPDEWLGEDDEDIEKVKLQYLDLSLRKFITAVNDKELVNEDGTYTREPVVDVTPLIDGTGTTAIYNHTKEPVQVKVGDHVIYTIRVYNEGSIDAYASEITDYLPPNLQYDENSEINKEYGWTISEDGRIAITNYSGNKELQAFNPDTKELDYFDVKIECIVTPEVKQGDKLTNIAEISEYKYDETIVEEDIDSESDNMEEDNYLPEDSDLPTYKDDEIDQDYVPGNEDDDDFEKIYVPIFDLALRKFITKVEDTDVTTRVPQVHYENGQITYEHTKEPVLVHVDDVVIYTIRVYNEGETSGYASEITDDIPEYLEYLPDHETNIQYLWTMYDADGNETENVDEAVKVKTTYLSKENETEEGENLLHAFDGNIDNLSYKDIQIAFKVKDPNSNSYIITNHAQISDDTDEDGEEIDDEDSKPDEWNEGEDDQDIENVKVEYFDLALLKYVTKVIVIEDGQEKVTETGYDGTEDPEPVVKVELNRKKLDSVVVKFGFGIKITNEGDIPGYATEITDYVPEGLRFEAADNPGWTDEGNNVISTRLLEGTLLQPGESATVEVILTWINGENNLAEKTNIAEISEDDNEHDVPDRDSTPDNEVPGEDDIDIAKVILAVSTGTAKTYFGLTLGLLSIISIGIILIKKFVL